MALYETHTHFDTYQDIIHIDHRENRSVLKEQLQPLVTPFFELFALGVERVEFPVKKFPDKSHPSIDERIVLYTQPEVLKQPRWGVFFVSQIDPELSDEQKQFLGDTDGILTFDQFANPEYGLAAYYSYKIKDDPHGNHFNIVLTTAINSQEFRTIADYLMQNEIHKQAAKRSQGEIYLKILIGEIELPYGLSFPAPYIKINELHIFCRNE